MATDTKSSPTGIGRRQIGSDASGSLPVYHQLHLIIGQRIRDRVYPPGALLPSEFLLAEQFGVSRVSVRRTLALLERDGLIVRRRGIGVRVKVKKKVHEKLELKEEKLESMKFSITIGDIQWRRSNNK
jgi:DNA-binding GntR family transcriptional regulator